MFSKPDLKMMSSDHSIVPVVMFHSIGLENSDWTKAYLSEPYKVFYKKIELLKKRGAHFWHWKQLHSYMINTNSLTFPAIVLTFDDGYLDSWVYAFPILKKFRAKATIFVNPEFIDPSTEPRPNLDDVWAGNLREQGLSAKGFLNLTEMKKMEETGLIDIQSHALSHTWYFSGPKLIDFHKPGDKKYPWLAWNMRPDLKPFYMSHSENSMVPWGTPIYEYEKALICRRYFPPEVVTEKIVSFVKQRGSEVFFQQKGWEIELREYHKRLMNKYKHKERFENKDDYKERVFFELSRSKQILEKALNKEIHFICWPGGAYNQDVIAMAKKAGYKAWTTSSQDRTSFRNRFGSDPTQIKRISSFSKYRIGNRREYGYAGAYYFICGIERHKGAFVYKWIGRSFLILAILKSGIKRQNVS
jgi:peptidoglycan/xylan/chitin deacetylase (PgdA/CDA1 family)